MKPGSQQTTQTLKPRCVEMAESREENAELLRAEVFPKTLKGTEWNAKGEGGEMWKNNTEEAMRKALFNQSVHSSPVPERLKINAFRPLQ